MKWENLVQRGYSEATGEEQAFETGQQKKKKSQWWDLTQDACTAARPVVLVHWAVPGEKQDKSQAGQWRH